MATPIPKPENLAPLIMLIRGEKVLLSQQLAELYGVSAKALNQAVRRNIDRFPADFMFQLSDQEFRNLKSQIVTSSWGGLRRAAPLVIAPTGSGRGVHYEFLKKMAHQWLKWVIRRTGRKWLINGSIGSSESAKLGTDRAHKGLKRLISTRDWRRDRMGTFMRNIWQHG